MFLTVLFLLLLICNYIDLTGKIKTLRLATSYIAYLSDVLSGDDPSRTPAAFTAEISRKMARGDDKRRKELLVSLINFYC